MPTSNETYNERTTGREIVSAYPDQVAGKIVLITGANPGGIGGSTAVSLAAAGPKVLILAGRNPNKLAETIENVKQANPNAVCRPLSLDLSSQESCRKAAQDILEDTSIPQIDILVNNAGVMDIEERTLSPEGIEMQFATNHIGHFLFTNLIMTKLTAAAKTTAPGETRVVNISSRAVQYGGVRFHDYNFTKLEKDLPEDEHLTKQTRELWDEMEDKPYIPQAAYGQSKSANVLFSVALNKRLGEAGIFSVAVHPGAINTELGRYIGKEKITKVFEKASKSIPNLYFKNLDEGCSTTLVAALDPKVVKEDLFFAECQVAGWAPEWATSPEKAEQLWKLSEELVGEQFSY